MLWLGPVKRLNYTTSQKVQSIFTIDQFTNGDDRSLPFGRLSLCFFISFSSPLEGMII